MLKGAGSISYPLESKIWTLPGQALFKSSISDSIVLLKGFKLRLNASAISVKVYQMNIKFKFSLHDIRGNSAFVDSVRTN